MRLSATAFCLLLVTTACGGSSNGDGAGGAGGSSSDAGTGGFAGDAGQSVGRRCAAPAPAGFEGPFLFGSFGSSGPMCFDGASKVVFEAGVTIAQGGPDDMSCTCKCLTSGVTCDAAVLEVYDPSGCSAAPSVSVVVPDGQCVASPVVPAGAMTRVRGQGSGTCAPSASVKSKGFARWTERNAACAPEAPEACEGGGVYLPDLPERVCVSQPGDVACPAGYDEKLLYYTAIDDPRTCDGSGCACGEADCLGSVLSLDADNCTGPGEQYAIPGGCLARDFKTSTMLHQGLPSCEVSGTAQGQGSAVPIDPITICCIQ